MHGSRKRRVVALCEEFGVCVEDVRVVAQTLIISPRRLASLPHPANLQKLGRELQKLGYENVACSVPTETDGTARTRDQ